MITRIQLLNFMSHIDTVLELAPGLTVLVGPNNCGKSAVGAALQAICQNTNGDFMMRHGQKETRVIVETHEGHRIEWIRKKATASYIINGKRIDRGQAPEELHDLLRLASVKEGKNSFDVHFGEQKTPIFLLDQPESRAASFFASSSDAEKLLLMQNLHREKRTECRRHAQRLATQVATQEAHLLALEPVESIQAQIQAAESRQADLQTSQVALEKLQRLVAELTRRQKGVDEARDILAALMPLTPPEPQTPTAPLEELLTKLPKAQAQAHKQAGLLAAMVPLVEPPVLEKVAPLEELSRRLATQIPLESKLRAQTQALDALPLPPMLADLRELEKITRVLPELTSRRNAFFLRHQALEPLACPPLQHDTQAIEKLTDSLRLAEKARQAARARSSLLENIPPLPPVETIEPLAQVLTQLTGAQNQVSRQQTAFLEVQEKLQEAVNLVELWAQDHPVCPTCGSAVEPHRLLLPGGHRHE